MNPGQDRHRLLIENLKDGFAYHQIITDRSGKPVDYVFLEVNPAFEKLTGLSRDEILNKRVTAVLPELINASFDWIGTYGKVALTGETASFESYSETLQRWYEVTAYSDAPGYFAVIFRDITEHKNSKEALKTNSGLITSLVDSIPDLVFYKDLDGFYLGCNAEFALHVGYEKEDIVGKTDYDLYSKEEADAFRENDRRMLELGTKRYNEEWISYPDGRKVLLDTLKTPYYNADGKQIGILGISRDITDRKQMEEALKTSEERLDLAMAVKNEGYWDWNLVTNETFFDDRYYTMAGYTPKEFPQTFSAWAERVHPDDLANAELSIQTYLAGKSERFNVEFRFKHKDGSWIWIRGQGKITERDATGLPLRMIGTHTDITDRKKAEETLRRREEEFRALVENAPDIVVRFDRKFRHIYVSPAIEKETSIPREQFIGKTHNELGWSPETAKARATVLQEVFDTAQEKTHYFEYKTPEGRKYYHSRNTPEFAPDGTVETVLAITRDITAIKEMEAALYQEKLKTQQLHRRALPDHLPKMRGLTLAASYIPAASLQGDYCNVIRRRNQLLLYLVDVDKSRDDGVMQSLYVRKAIEDYLQAHAEDTPVSPALLLRYLQDRFQQDNRGETGPLCVLIAVFENQPAAEDAGSYSPELLRYASTGFCTPPLLITGAVNPDGFALENLYLAGDDGTELQEHTITVVPGSTFIFSTDGLFKQGPDAGSYELRLRELLNKQAHLPPELISQAVENDFAEFYSDYPLQNDLALIVVQVPRQEQCLSFKVESEFQQISAAKDKVSALLEKELNQGPNLLHFHELLVNAVEHGNKQDGAKNVAIDLTITDRYYKAVITDQGEGFNWRDRINRELDLEGDSERGRGIIMTRMMTDYLGYNERGNRVTMINLLEK